MAFPSTVRQIEARMAALANNPDFRPFCERVELPNRTHEGTTRGLPGRIVSHLRIGTGVGEGRQRVLIVSGIHAREFAPPDAVMTFVEKLLAAYRARGPLTYPRFDDRRVAPTIPFAAISFPFDDVRRIVEETELYVLPLANPDGRAFAQAAARNNMWRKNRRPPPTGSRCVGVDINRNFDVGWDFAKYYSSTTLADLVAGRGGTLGVSDDPCEETYHGPAPPVGRPRVREPETENIVGLLRDKDINFYLDVHSAAAHILFPWGLEQNQERATDQTFKNPDFDAPASPGRDAMGTAYKEWMPPGAERLNRDVAEAMNNAILDSTGFTAAAARGNPAAGVPPDPIAVRARASSDYTPVQSLFLFGSASPPDFEPGGSDDFAFSRQIDATPGPTVRAFARDPIVSLTFECGRAADGGFHPRPTTQFPKVEREVGAGLFAFILIAARRRVAPAVTTLLPTLPPSTTRPPLRPPPRRRQHVTSAYEFQSTGILLAGAGEHDVRVLGTSRVTPPPLPPATKQELEPAGDPSLYERYFGEDLSGEQEDPDVRPFHPRVPALFVTDRGEPLFLERDWSGIEIALADFPALPDAGGDAPAPSPTPGGRPSPPGQAPAAPGTGDLIDVDYLARNQDAMRYVKLSAGDFGFHSSYEPLPHGDLAFDALLTALRDVEDEIFLATWFLEPSMELSRADWDQPVAARRKHALDEVLLARARADVTVRVLVWNFLNLGLAANIASGSGGPQGGGKTEPLSPIMGRVRKLAAALAQISPKNEVVVVEHPMPFATRTVLGISFPLGGSHHQKIWILRSGKKHTAFVGGINLRQWDWDTAVHEVLDQRRSPADMEGSARKARESAKQDPDYGPRHDWAVKVEGPAAYRVLQEFDRRWGMAGRGRLTLVSFADVPPGGKLFVQKSHTWPIAFGGGSREIVDAYKHAFAQAKRYVYVEDQYWTSDDLTTALEAQLRMEQDLQVVIVLPDKAEDPGVGPFIAGEQWFQLSRLWSVAPSRVRAYVLYKKHPVRSGYVNVYVHAKIAVVDDLWATIGSANTNNRSMIIDTECNAQVAHGATVKKLRKRAWRELLPSGADDDDPVKAILTRWHPTGEENQRLMAEEKELRGLIVPLKEPEGGGRRLPEVLRPLL